MNALSVRPTFSSRLSTYLSGQAPGRIGSAAGVLGAKGTPTSMRGRFAKYGAMYGNEAGAQAALMPSDQAQQADESGALQQTENANTFDQNAYEQQQRQRRGMVGTGFQRRTFAPQPAAQPVNSRRANLSAGGITGTSNLDTAENQLAAQTRAPFASAQRATPLPAPVPAAPKPYAVPSIAPMLKPRVNWTDSYQQGFGQAQAPPAPAMLPRPYNAGSGPRF